MLIFIVFFILHFRYLVLFMYIYYYRLDDKILYGSFIFIFNMHNLEYVFDTVHHYLECSVPG